jgi:hypothetical protein
VIWPSDTKKTLNGFINVTNSHLALLSCTPLCSHVHFVNSLVSVHSNILFLMIQNAEMLWTFRMNNCYLQLQLPDITPPGIQLYIIYDFTEYACYQQQKLAFGKGWNCYVAWSIGTSHCCLAVLSVCTNNSGCYIMTEWKAIGFHIVTWMAKELLDNDSVNTLKRATIEAVSQWICVYCLICFL